MAALAFALGSSLLWGVADFLGGLKSRTYPVAVVLAVMYSSSLAVMTIFVVARGEGPPDTEAVVAALSAGLVGISALAAFYRALAIGTMSIVAPIASTGVALPVIVGVAGGEHPGAMRAIGIAAAVVGVVLASREEPGGPVGPREQRQSILLALVAGLGFGSYFVGAEIASREDVGWALLLSRVAATPIVLAIAILAVRRGGTRPGARTLAALGAIGLCDLAANAAYNHATTLGDLSVVSVASSLYPVTTVMLAAVVLGERVRGVQRVGVVVALTGVLLIAAGG
ncbi:MAG: EamA family transporter [Solirubrobacteraceae bacterium]